MENDNNCKSIDVLNFCILVGKYYIYVSKLNKSKVFIFEYIHSVKNKLEIIKMMHSVKGNLDVFDNHWSTLYNNI